MVDAFGLETALRVITKVTNRLRQRADQLRKDRDADNPDCFSMLVSPVVCWTKGGTYRCTFTIDDQTEGPLRVVGCQAEFRPIGPLP